MGCSGIVIRRHCRARRPGHASSAGRVRTRPASPTLYEQQRGIRGVPPRAAELVKYTLEGTLRAVEAFERALQRDPGYVLARAGLAMACAEMYLRFATAGEVERWGERAEAEARAALDLDPELAEAHLARAAVARKREFDWNGTMASGRRALALNPNLDQARFFVAGALYHNGYMKEALIEMEKGRSLRGKDVIEPIRIEALVALFSAEFAPARVHLER
jgi:tetratricopeptide (TPR) repeat protein